MSKSLQDTSDELDLSKTNDIGSDRYRPVQIDQYRFSEAQGDVEFIELAPSVRTVPISPTFILGAMQATDASSMFSNTKTGSAGYYVVRNAVLTHDGITLHRSNLLTSLLTNFPEHHCLDMVKNIPNEVASATPRFLSERAVLMIGPGITTWGHWLVDFLPRLFLMHVAGWDIAKLKWIITKQTPKFALQLLGLVGISKSSLEVYDPTIEMLGVKELIIPTNLSAGPLMHPLFNEAVAWLKRRLGRTLIESAARHDRVFLSRSSVAFQRMLGNRDIIETIARAAGYTVVDPARLPVPDQLGLFYSATRIVGEYGSGLHTSIFAPTGAMIICLRGPNHTAGVIQNGLVKACSQRIGYVFGNPTPDSPIEAYTIPPELLQQALEFTELVI